MSKKEIAMDAEIVTRFLKAWDLFIEHEGRHESFLSDDGRDLYEFILGESGEVSFPEWFKDKLGIQAADHGTANLQSDSPGTRFTQLIHFFQEIDFQKKHDLGARNKVGDSTKSISPRLYLTFGSMGYKLRGQDQVNEEMQSLGGADKAYLKYRFGVPAKKWRDGFPRDAFTELGEQVTEILPGDDAFLYPGYMDSDSRWGTWYVIVQIKKWHRGDIEVDSWERWTEEAGESWQEAEAGIKKLVATPRFRDFCKASGFQSASELEELQSGWSGSDTDSKADQILEPGTGDAPEKALNIIRQGPPGTGKTFSTRKMALQICGLWSDDLEHQQEEQQRRFEELMDRGRVNFVTFHQSYSYEEFVEGIRPVMGDTNIAGVVSNADEVTDEDSKKEPEYEIVDGTFKSISNTAGFAYWFGLLLRLVEENDIRLVVPEKEFKGKTGDSFFVLEPYNARDGVRGYPFDPESKKRLKDKYHQATYEDLKALWLSREELKSYESAQVKQILASFYGKDRHRAHHTFIWKVFELLLVISGERKLNEVGVLSLPWKDSGEVESYWKTLQTEYAAAERHLQHVLIIDEINRGNISKILGELITLLEPNKRLGCSESLVVELPYSGEKFAVPPNLHVIGTMNTADRSIALMDVALRRRFKFQELMPDSNILRSKLVSKIGDQEPVSGLSAEKWAELVVGVMESINDRICLLYDREHQIGHSYFMEAVDPTSLREVLLDEVIPLVQEYFYGQADKICTVLGCPYKGENLRGGKNEGTKQVFEVEPLEAEAVLGFDNGDYPDAYDYKLAEEFVGTGEDAALSDTYKLLQYFGGILTAERWSNLKSSIKPLRSEDTSDADSENAKEVENNKNEVGELV